MTATAPRSPRRRARRAAPLVPLEGAWRSAGPATSPARRARSPGSAAGERGLHLPHELILIDLVHVVAPGLGAIALQEQVLAGRLAGHVRESEAAGVKH